jgi:predicted ATPase/DNA-binding SARP family transcriptional activator
MADAVFGVLGAVEVRRADGTEVAVGGPRVRSLLALLLLNDGRVVTAGTLIDGLYGENPPGDAANALQSQVSRLRRGLRGTGCRVELHPAGYRLDVAPEAVDARRFERLARDGRRALAAGDPAGAAGLLRDGLALWRGPALADVTDAPFAGTAATGLEELRVAALTDRLAAELALGERAALVPELRDLVAAYPLREGPRGLLMRALAGCGRQAEALEVFEDARRLLADELGADPSPELAATHLAILRGEPTTTHPGSATDNRAPASGSGQGGAPSNDRTAGGAPLGGGGTGAGPAVRARTGVPAQLTSFVGREEELARVGGLLAGAARLVTLTGPGGAGKTRLAIEAGLRADGEVCFVELAAVGRGEVLQAVMAALGIRDTGLRDTFHKVGSAEGLRRVAGALAGRPVLVVVDNCEHVVGEVARLAHRLLGACPALRVLATSREALGITGETLCPVGQLGVAPEGATASEAGRWAATRLFAERAAAVRPGFVVDDGNVAAVTRICAALDGMPLAIELAAARLRSLPVAEVAVRLDDRFRLLSRGDRTAAPRHQTLRAVVEWSWELLDPAEQALARRLATFTGGFTVDTATTICGTTPAAPGAAPQTTGTGGGAGVEAVGDLLGDLAEKSLVDDLGGGRYRMLETIRAFCAERLLAAGEDGAVRERHARYFLGLVDEADPHLRTGAQLEWLARLDAEHGNLLAAVRWAVGGAPRLALRLLAGLSWYWWLRGLRSEAAPLAAEVLAAVGGAAPDGLREEYVLCQLNAMAGGGTAARAGLDASRPLLAALGGPPRRPYTLVLWAMGVGPTTLDERESAAILTDPEPWLVALAELGDALLRMFGGDLAGAEELLQRSLAGFRAVGDRWGIANALDQLVALTELGGGRAAALRWLEEALAAIGELGAGEDAADLLCHRGDWLLRGGDLAGARASYQEAAGLAGRSGALSKVGDARLGLGEVARLGGDLAAARRYYASALECCPADWFAADLTRSRILVATGRAAEADGDAAAARDAHRRAAAAASQGPYAAFSAFAAEGLAGVALLEGDGRAAARLLGAGRALRGGSIEGDPDVARVAAAARATLGDPAYDRAFDEGAALPQHEALALLTDRADLADLADQP